MVVVIRNTALQKATKHVNLPVQADGLDRFSFVEQTQCPEIRGIVFKPQQTKPLIIANLKSNPNLFDFKM